MKKKSKISKDNYFKSTVCLNSNSGSFFGDDNKPHK